MAGNLAPTNILDLANYVQQQGDLGRQQGTAQRFNRLAGEAYAAPAGQNRLALLGQAVQTDPTAGMALGNQLAATDKAAETDHMKKIRGAAQFALDAIKSGDPARIKGAGNAVGPYLTQLTGKQFPGLSADMLPAIYQVLAQTGGMPDQKGVVLSAGGQLRNPMTGELLADNPQSLQYHDVPMGQGKAAGVFDPSTGKLRPAVGGAQSAPPQGDPMQPYIAQANQAVQLGADPAKVQAWLMQQAQQMGAQPQGGTMGAPAPAGMGQPAMPEQQAAPAQFGVGTPKPSAQGVPSGYQWNADHSALAPIPGGPADKGSSAMGLGDPNATGDSFLQTVQDAGMRNLIKGIAEGRVQVPRIYRSSKAGEVGATEIAAAVAQYDPSFNAQDFNSRNRTRIAFTSGRPYQDMTALNQVAQHIGHLAQQIDGTSGIAAPLGLGTLINKGVNAAADPYTGKVTAYQSTADAVAHETRKLFAGSSGGTLAELQNYIDMLKADNSTAQKKAALQNIAQLVQSRIGILRQGYEQGMGKAGDPFATTFPESARLLQQVAGDGDAQQAPQPPASPAAAGGWSIQKVQ